jgi:hypothetical protein
MVQNSTLKGIETMNFVKALASKKAAVLSTVTSLAAVGSAQTVDWTGQATSLGTTMTPAINAGIGVGFVVLGITVAYKLFKKFVH